MSEKSWVLRGVDAEARQAALAEAERRGLSLSDYLTEVLLGDVLATQLTDQPVVEPAAEAVAPRAGRENFAFRHRVEALERRLAASLGGLEGALQALDSNVLSLAAQLDETGVLAEDGAAALIDLATNVAALRKRLTDVENTAEAYIENNEDAHEGLMSRCAGLEAHLTSVESIAYAADSTAARLAETQEALQRALAQDFNAFAHETDRRLESATQDMQALAEAAAAHADAAAQRAIEALRLTREAMEQSLHQQVEETRAAVHGAFVDAAERIDAVADRVLDNQRISQRMGEQLNARINNLEDAAHAAIEDTAETLRHADAAIQAEIARIAQDGRSVATELAARQDDADQRLKVLDFALNNAIAGIDGLRDEAAAQLADAETVIEARQGEIEQDLRARLDAVISRLDHMAEAAAQDGQTTASNIDRVEACTFAALEKLSRDIAAGDAAQATQAHEQHTALLARIAVIDKAVGAQDQSGDALRTRIERLEGIAQDTRTEQALATLTEEVEALAKQTRDGNGAAQLAHLQARVEAQDGLINDSADRAHGVARMLSRVTAQSADMVSQAEDRIHRLELGLADMRLELTAQEAAQAVADRVSELEESQSAALDSLRAEIGGFIDSFEQRFEALERGGVAALTGDEVLIAHAIEARLTELEQRDVASAFDTLRQRIEDRLLGVERSSVRALEQMADTIALIEKRYSEDDDQAVARSA